MVHRASDGLALRLDDRRIDEPGVQFARGQIGKHLRHGGKHPQLVLQRSTQAALGQESLSGLSVNGTLLVGIADGLDFRILEVLRRFHIQALFPRQHKHGGAQRLKRSERDVRVLQGLPVRNEYGNPASGLVLGQRLPDGAAVDLGQLFAGLLLVQRAEFGKHFFVAHPRGHGCLGQGRYDAQAQHDQRQNPSFHCSSSLCGNHREFSSPSVCRLQGSERDPPENGAPRPNGSHTGRVRRTVPGSP